MSKLGNDELMAATCDILIAYLAMARLQKYDFLASNQDIY
jgi:hypothetical protein